MDQINEILAIPLLVYGETSLTVQQLLLVITVVASGAMFIIWSSRRLRVRMQKSGVNADVVHLVSRAYLIIAFVILAFMTLEYLNVPLAAFAFVSGAVAIGFGFGAQNIINNFISGWILMWERPIKIGDFLELGEVRGTVESIDTRSTRVRRTDGVHLLVPNSFLLENTVTNWTLIDRLVRTSVVVGVAYGSDVNLVRNLLDQAAREMPDVLSEPPHSVLFEDFGDSALIFALDIWVVTGAERGLRVIRSDLRFSIDALFAQHNVVIAFPQRDVHVDGNITVHQHGAVRPVEQ
jgi:small-conductance mechanosensitive channel